MTALLYHDVLGDPRVPDSGFPGADAAIYKLERATFEQHLDAIAARAPVFSGPETALTASLRRPELAILTFDDGGASAWPVIAEALERRGWRGVFFITTGRIGTPGFLDGNGVRALARAGHLVGSHSVSHPLRMAALDTATLRREWTESRDQLVALLGGPVRLASVPGGSHSPAVATAAREAGYAVLFTSEPRRAPWRAGSLLLTGRYSVVRSTPARRAASLGAGDRRACAWQTAAWSGKKVLKRLGGPAWLGFRRWYWEWKAR